MCRTEINGAPNSGRAIYPGQIITTEHLDHFKNELLSEFRRMLEERTGAVNKKWLKSFEVRELLQISPGTLQNLRVNGTLPFTKVGGVMYYEYADIQRIMDQNRKNQ